MSASTIREPEAFGKRRQVHSIAITRNGRTRHININPIFFVFSVSVVAVFMVGYLTATAYLIFRDDLLGASRIHYVRTVNEYEDRIAALRTRLDRITSRQLLDQQAIEAKVAALMNRQSALGDRGGRFGALVDRARESGIKTQETPVPTPRPDGDRASIDTLKTAGIASIDGIRLSADVDGNTAGEKLQLYANAKASAPRRGIQLSSGFTESLFGDIAEQLEVIDLSQRQELDDLRQAAHKKSTAIRKELAAIGIRASMPEDANATGGPFVPAEGKSTFDQHVAALDASLDYLDGIRKTARSTPIFTPAPGQSISSRFGSRKDPFNGRRAMHSGIDFRGKTGTPVRASGSGTVIKAGRNGGYGNMVEVRHVGGLTTRYAHLSKISVKKGQKVKAGQKIGLIGSTGRSTGPHLHFEVRNKGEAVDPMTFLRVGKRIHPLL